MKLFRILGFLLIALSVPVFTVLVTAFVSSKTIPLSMEQDAQIKQEIQKIRDTALTTGKIKQQKDRLSENIAMFKNALNEALTSNNQKIIDLYEPRLAQAQKELETLEQQEKATGGNLLLRERGLLLIIQTPFLRNLFRLLSIVSIIVFLAILALSRFFKSRFLQSSLLIGALTTLIFGITYSPITTLLLILAILYTTYKIYEPDSCPL